MTSASEAAIVDRLRSAGCVFAEDEARLLVDAAASDDDHLAAMVDRRVAGEPLEHLLGWAEFAGLKIVVDAGVFVPRRRSELLVRVAADALSPGQVVVDLCCGSGAIGTAIAASVRGVEVYAADVDPIATDCARRNLMSVGGEVFTGDLFAAMPVSLRGRVDVVAVNAPYVPTNALTLMPPEARLHEPRVALDGGADGLDVHRRIAIAAPDWLGAGGLLVIETSEAQAPVAVELFADVGLTPRVVTDDDLGATVVVGRRPTNGGRP